MGKCAMAPHLIAPGVCRRAWWARYPGMKTRSLSVGLVGENDANRLAVTRELSGPEVGVLRDYYLQFDTSDLIAEKHDAVIIDLDHDVERALDMVRNLTKAKVPTVMVYSAHAEPELTK